MRTLSLLTPKFLRAAWFCVLFAFLLSTSIEVGFTQHRPDFVPGRVLVKFRPEVSPVQVQSIVAAAGARIAGQIPRIGVLVLQLPPNASEVAYARAFRQRRDVIFAELDHIIPLALTPNDPLYAPSSGRGWHLAKIGAPNAWDTTLGSNRVIVAVLDTGVDGTHPDLAPNLVPGWNIYNNNADTSDVHGHGTAVAGTVAAVINNGIGIASVAGGCRIMPIRISDPNGYASYTTIANGLIWAADHGARIANVSYRCSNSSTVATAAQYFQSKNGVVAVAAGNESTFDATADNPYVLTVSATDSSDSLTSWSNTGNNIDLAAPGSGIYTTIRGGTYGSKSGTSFSAPVVAGVAALVISVNPNLTGGQVQDVLKRSADDLGAASWDPQYGWGRVNAARAVSMALSLNQMGDTTPPSVSFSSPTNGATVSGTITVQINASDNVGVASVSLYLNGALLSTKTAAPYTFSFDTTRFANGSYTLRAVAADATGNTASAQINLSIYNTADTTPPTIRITSPVDGARVNGTISVAVATSDDRAVVRVELYVDGRLTATSTSAPFTTQWNASKAPRGAHTLQCKAYDAAGNVGISQSITVYK
jgi:thermitase